MEIIPNDVTPAHLHNSSALKNFTERLLSRIGFIFIPFDSSLNALQFCFLFQSDRTKRWATNQQNRPAPSGATCRLMSLGIIYGRTLPRIELRSKDLK